MAAGVLARGALLQALDDEVAALGSLEAAHAGAAAAGADAALAGAAVCIVAPSWGDLGPLAKWCARVRAVREAPADPAERLLFLAGRMHAENVFPAGSPATLAADAAETKRLLFANVANLPPELALVAAEPLIDHFGQSGEGAALREVEVLIRGSVERAEPRLAARSLFWLGNNLRLVDATQAAAKAFDGARAISERTGWYWIRVQLIRAAARPAVEGRDRARIDALLDEFESLLRPERPLDWGDFHHLRGWDALLSGDARDALQHYRLAVEAADRGSLQPHMASVYRGGVASSLILLGRADEAAEVYAANRVYETERGAKAQQASISLALAWHARGQGAPEYAGLLREGLAAAREFNLINLFRPLPGIVSQLCSDALDGEIEAEFARKLVAARKLAPPADASDAWPWSMRTQCLGEFALFRGSERVEFPGKSQLKPLELVKLLASNDNRPLPVARVMELLWPDSEADAARKAFDVALTRLRKLLDSNDAFGLDGGMLVTDERVAWNDAAHFARVAARADGLADGNAGAGELLRTAAALAHLYRGAFLAHEAPLPWILEARERMKNRFLRAVEIVGGQLEARAMLPEAIRLYDRATEVEPLAEALYRRLMLAHLVQGSPADAMRAYRRCREMLSILLSIAPSRETLAVVERIQKAHP